MFKLWKVLLLFVSDDATRQVLLCPKIQEHAISNVQMHVCDCFKRVSSVQLAVCPNHQVIKAECLVTIYRLW